MSSRSVLAMLDYSEAKGIDTCTPCPKLCRWACPVAEVEARETVSPHALVVLSGFVKRGLTSAETAGSLPYHCTFCGACTEACLHKNDVPLLMSLARNRALDGHISPEGAREVRGHFGVAGNPQGTSLHHAIEAASESAGLALEASPATMYFPGCRTLESAPEIATAFLRASRLFGISDVGVSRESASCCGLELFWAGDLEGFRSHAERFADRVRDVETIAVHDPACAHGLSVRYRDVGVALRPRVVHISEFLDERLRSTRSLSRVSGVSERVAYADSCSLSRGMRIMDAPRRLLLRATDAAAVELPGLRGLDVDCCGAAGLLPATVPATAFAMGQARIRAFKESGAERLAMFSPRCAAHLKHIDPTLPVVDGSMLLARL